MSLAVAHLFSGSAFGASARLPWSIYLWNEHRHPTQVYEIVAVLLEGQRGDSMRIAGGFRAGLVEALFVLGICIWLMRRRSPAPPRAVTA